MIIKNMFAVEKIRKDFPILKRKVNGKTLVYFDNAATTQKPVQVIGAIVDYYRKHNANVHRGIHRLSEEATRMMEEARKRIANFIGASSEKEIVFVRNASEALNLILYAWAEKEIGKEDAIVTSIMEHHSNFVGWQQLAIRKQASLRVIDITGEGELAISNKEGGEISLSKGEVKIGSLGQLLDEKVKLLAITQASNVLGTINPIKAISKLVHKKAPRAIIVVDGAQSVPQMPVNVKKLGVDFLAFSGHKMLGPTGIGVLWGKQELLENMEPFLFGGDMIAEVNLEASSWNKLPWKFEAGTPNIAGAIGLGAAVSYLESLGMEAVRNHEKELVAYALAKMNKLKDEGVIELYGPKQIEDRGGLVSFNVRGAHAHDTAQILDSEGIAVRSGHHCAMPLSKRLGVVSTARASFYIYNTEEEIDRLISGISKVRRVLHL